jgi:hypothetical protein
MSSSISKWIERVRNLQIGSRAIVGLDKPGCVAFGIFEAERRLARLVAEIQQIEAIPAATRAVISEPIGGRCDITLSAPLTGDRVIIRHADGRALLDTGIDEAKGAAHWALIFTYDVRIIDKMQGLIAREVEAIEFEHEHPEA